MGWGHKTTTGRTSSRLNTPETSDDPWQYTPSGGNPSPAPLVVAKGGESDTWGGSCDSVGWLTPFWFGSYSAGHTPSGLGFPFPRAAQAGEREGDAPLLKFDGR